jgi:hypothetical protein
VNHTLREVRNNGSMLNNLEGCGVLINQIPRFGIDTPICNTGAKEAGSDDEYNTKSTENLLDAAWETTKIECGLGNNFMTLGHRSVEKIISLMWMSTLWEFLDEYGIKLKKICQNLLVLEGDCYLTHKSFKTGICDFQIFNFCRLYLQVTTLSDIITANGKQIRHSIWHGQNFKHHNKNEHWPRQPLPSNGCWNSWRRALRIMYYTNEDGKFDIPLPPIKATKNWKWYYSGTEQRLYHMSENKIWYMTVARKSLRQSRRHNLRFYKTRHAVPRDSVPPDILPATVYNIHDSWVIDGIGIIGEERDEALEIDKWESSIQENVVGNVALIQHDLEEDGIVLVSDGSVKNGFASGAWVITSRTLLGDHYIEGSARTTGTSTTRTHIGLNVQEFLELLST